MITQLTQAQLDQIKIYTNKWNDLSTTTTPANRPQAEDAIRLAYKLANCKQPDQIIWFDSPMALCDYRTTLDTLNLRFKLFTMMQSKAKQAIAKLFTVDQYNTIRVPGWSLFQAASDTFQWDVAIAINNKTSHMFSGQMVSPRDDSYSMCQYDYCINMLGLTELSQFVGGLIAVAEHAGWWCPTETVCLVAERPCAVRYDANNAIHSDNSCAIEYPDGWGIYMWRGVAVPEHVILRPHEITPDEIMSEWNAEVARIMLDRYGQDNFIRNGGFTIQQSDDYGDLYRIEFEEHGDEPIVAVHVKDPSTDREYFLYVPPHILTAHEGVAWTFGYDNPSDYNPLKET